MFLMFLKDIFPLSIFRERFRERWVHKPVDKILKYMVSTCECPLFRKKIELLRAGWVFLLLTCVRHNNPSFKHTFSVSVLWQVLCVFSAIPLELCSSSQWKNSVSFSTIISMQGGTYKIRYIIYIHYRKIFHHKA